MALWASCPVHLQALSRPVHGLAQAVCGRALAPGPRFFDFGGLQVEYIEPNEAPSVWRDHLRRHGEGVHHIAFGVKGMNKAIERCEQWGMTLEQKGEYRRGNGRYAYLNALEDLKIFVELLESDE